MTEEATHSTLPGVTAGALLRQYREAQGLQIDALANALRVAAVKLEALEADRLSDLPDAMFARALTLAVCRQLRVDAAPVLALLPGQDMSRLAPKNERGLDFPLDRPSLLPQSSFLVVTRFFTPMRWAALAVLALAVILGFWPDLHALFVFKDDPSAEELVVVPVAAPVTALPLTEATVPVLDNKANNMVVTTVHSAAVAAQAASAAITPSVGGASDAK